VHEATPLHYACRFNQDSKIVKLLLHRAAAGSLSTFNKTLEFEPANGEWQSSPNVQEYINLLNVNNQNAHEVAIGQHHDDIADFVVQYCGTKSARESPQQNLKDFEMIREAIYNHDDDQVITLLRSWSHMKNNGIIQGPNKETALHVACVHDRGGLVEKLLNCGRSSRKNQAKALVMYSKPFGYTPLLTAVHAGHDSCFKIIFDYLSTNPEHIKESCIANREGLISENGYATNCLRYTTVLHLCVNLNRTTMLAHILEMIKDNNHLVKDFVEPFLKAFDSENRTPMYIGAHLGYEDACKLLFDLGNLFRDRPIDHGSIFLKNRTDTDASLNETPGDQVDVGDDQPSAKHVFNQFRVSCFPL
jgi:ankyrin repeat protein